MRSIVEPIGEADAASGVVFGCYSRDGGPAGPEPGLHLEVLGQIDLHLSLGAAGAALPGADIDALRNVFARLDRRARVGEDPAPEGDEI